MTHRFCDICGKPALTETDNLHTDRQCLVPPHLARAIVPGVAIHVTFGFVRHDGIRDTHPDLCQECIEDLLWDLRSKVHNIATTQERPR